MKQTNNAIKFLMAQYRAIFQNAYFKGLATAAVVTMGLAAGQAQAASLEDISTIVDDTGRCQRSFQKYYKKNFPKNF